VEEEEAEDPTREGCRPDMDSATDDEVME
jgi:hypothetical protein